MKFLTIRILDKKKKEGWADLLAHLAHNGRICLKIIFISGKVSYHKMNVFQLLKNKELDMTILVFNF
jgi:hypothetical protein